MPLYEFKCSDCGERFEELCQSLEDSINCCSCGKPSKRVFSTFRTGRGSGGGGLTSSGSSGGGG